MRQLLFPKPYSISLGITTLMSFFAVIYVWRRQSAPGATPLVVFLLGIAIWSGGFAIELAGRIRQRI